MTAQAVLMATLATRRDGELAEVWRSRFHEAVEAGLSVVDATVFADSHEDIGLLRRLVRDGCSPELIARIVL